MARPKQQYVIHWLNKDGSERGTTEMEGPIFRSALRKASTLLFKQEHTPHDENPVCGFWVEWKGPW